MLTNYTAFKVPLFYVVDSREKLLKHLPKFVRDSILIFRRKADMSPLCLRKHKLIKLLFAISHRNSFQDSTRPLFHQVIKPHGKVIREINSKFRRPGYFLSIGKTITHIRNLRSVNLDLGSLANWKMFFHCRNIRSLSLWVLAALDTKKPNLRGFSNLDEIEMETSVEDIENSLPKWLKKSLHKLRRHLALIGSLNSIRIDGQMNPLTCLLLRILSQSKKLERLDNFGLSLVDKIDKGLHQSLKDLEIWKNLTTLDYSTSIKSEGMLKNLLETSGKEKRLTRLLLTFDKEVEDWGFLRYVGDFDKLIDFNLTILTRVDRGAKSLLENFTLAKTIKRLELTIDLFDLEFNIDNVPVRERFIQQWKNLTEIEDVYLIITCLEFNEYHMEFYKNLLESIRTLLTLHLVLQENYKVKTKHPINFANFFRGILETVKTVQDFHIDARRINFSEFAPKEFSLKDCASITLKGELEDFAGVNNFLTTLAPKKALTLKMHKESLTEDQFFERLKLLLAIKNLSTIRMTYEIDEYKRKNMVKNLCEFVRGHETLASVALQLDGIGFKPTDYETIEEAFFENKKIMIVKLTNDYYTKVFKKPNADDYYFEED